jgi:hypothetical protein
MSVWGVFIFFSFRSGNIHAPCGVWFAVLAQLMNPLRRTGNFAGEIQLPQSSLPPHRWQPVE